MKDPAGVRTVLKLTSLAREFRLASPRKMARNGINVDRFMESSETEERSKIECSVSRNAIIPNGAGPIIEKVSQLLSGHRHSVRTQRMTRLSSLSQRPINETSKS